MNRKSVLSLTLVFLCLSVAGQHAADSLLSLLKKTSEKNQPDILLSLSRIYLNNAPDKSIHYASQALAIANDLKRKPQIAQAELMLGKAKLVQDNYNEAFDNLSQARQHFKEQNKPEGEAECLLLIGDIYRENGDLSSALQKYTESFGIVTADFGIHDYSDHLERLGATTLKLGSLQKSEDYFGNGYESAKKFRNHPNMINCLNGLGQIDLVRREHDSAISHFSKALRIAQQYNLVSGIIKSLMNLGDAHKKKGNNKLAEQYYQEALKYSQQISDRYHQGLIQANLGDVYVAMNDMKSAVSALKESQSIASGIGNGEILLNDYRKSAQAARSMGNDSLAKQYELLAKYLEDSIHRLESNERLKRVQVLYDKEKRLKQYEMLEEEQQQYWLIIIIGCVALSLLLMLAAILFLQLRKHRRMEAHFEHLSHELEVSNQRKDRLIGIISHDLRGPVSTIASYTDLLLESFDEYTKDSLKENLQNINLLSKSSSDLVHNLLEWSRIQMTTGQELRLEPVNVFKVAESVTTLLYNQALQKGIHIHNKVKPDCLGLANEQMLQTVLRNLVSNGIKFTKKGGIVEITSRSFEPRIELTVTDNGIGMDENVLEQLFKLDVNKVSHGTANERGTGLGLVLCKDIIEKHGSKLFIESQMGQGTSISFVLEMANHFDKQDGEVTTG